MGFLFQTTFFHSGNLVPSPVRRGKVRMGGFAALGKIKFAQHIEPPSPQPSPAGRERGQAATSRYKFLSDYRYSRAGGNPLLNLSNCFSNISFLGFLMDSRLRGNDDSRGV